MPLEFLVLTINSFAWIAACILVGLLYALLIYPITRNSEKLRFILFTLRTIAVAVIAWLVFAPAIKTSTKLVEKPLIIIAQDNSASLAISIPKEFNADKYQQDMLKLEKDLSSDFEVKSYHFGKGIHDSLKFSFNEKLSNPSSVFKLANEQFGGRNIGAIILATDGIYNYGGNPQYETKSIKSPVYTIALGDTIPKKDILISNIAYNKNVFLNNRFVIEVDITAWQSKGFPTTLTVSNKGRTVYTKTILIDKNEFRKTIPISLIGNEKGIQKYTISLSPILNELSTQNNSQTIFVEVINGKQTIAIIASSPHPDISALKQSIEVNQNYTVELIYSYKPNKPLLERADLVILYQIPSIKGNDATLIKKTSQKPLLYILGSGSNINAFSSSQSLLKISSNGNYEETFAGINPSFFAFTLTDSTKKKISNFAPLLSPFGNYQLQTNSITLLHQKIGTVATTNPVLTFGDDGVRKIGILTGEGLWRWRLEDFQENNSHQAVDELVGKTIQYLISKDDKKKFRSYSSQSSFSEDEPIVINAELYNDAYELVNTPDVTLHAENEKGKKFNFLFSRNGNSYLLNAGELPAGEYSFTASTKLGDKTYTDRGKFIVSSQDIEYRQTTASHQLLHNIASQSSGVMLHPNEVNKLAELIKNNENIKTISYEDNRYNDIVYFKWIFFLILGLLSLEWFARKRNGEI